jgi:histone-lysine N-methyltransferase SETMAR
MLTYIIVLHHDNGRPHTVAGTRAHLENLSSKLFAHPRYSPDLASSDYHLFTYLENWLRSRLINNNEELMEVLKTWLSSQAANFFDTGTQKHIPRYDRCLNLCDDHVEM